MNINYWECEFGLYDELWAGGEELRCYGCTHPDGDGVCLLENKYGGDIDDCKLLDIEGLDE